MNNITKTKINLETLKENSFKNNRHSGILLVESLNNMKKVQDLAMDDLDTQNPNWASNNLLEMVAKIIGMLNKIKDMSKSENMSGSFGVTVGVHIMQCLDILNDILNKTNKN